MISAQKRRHASFAGATGGDGNGMQVGLDQVRLRVGDTDAALRRTPLRNGDAALKYHRIENSGRVAIMLYPAQTVTLPPAR